VAILRSAAVVFLSLGVFFTVSMAHADPSVPGLPRYENEYIDRSNHHVRIIISNPTEGLAIMINNNTSFIKGNVRAISVPSIAYSTSSGEKLVGHILHSDQQFDSSVFVVDGNIVIVHDGNIRTIPYPDLLSKSKSMYIEMANPAPLEGALPTTVFRVVDSSVDLLRTFIISEGQVYETEGFNSAAEIESAYFKDGGLTARINGMPVLLNAVDSAIDSAKSRSVVSIGQRVNRLLSHPSLRDIRIESHSSRSSGGDPLVEYLNRTFDIIRSVDLKPESEAFFKGELRRAAVGLNMKTGGGVRVTGRPGTGKTYLSNLIVSHIYGSEGLEKLKESIYIRIEKNTLNSGPGLVGDFENKVRALTEVAKVVPVVLLIDEMHTLIGAGTHSQNPIDFFQSIKGELESGRIKIIGTTTEAEWAKYFSGDKALADRFPVAIQTREPKKDDTLKIMRDFLNRLYPEQSSAFSEQSLAEALSYSEQFDAVGANPRKALRLLDYLAAQADLTGERSVSTKELLQSASEYYQFDLSKLTPTALQQSLKNLKAHLDKNLAGLDSQKEAMELVLADHFLHQLRGQRKAPTAVMFYGDRGTGKTVFATQIAKGLNFEFKRLMMASFTGFNGADQFKTALAVAIRANPFVVILLDEIEKAPAEVQQVLLQILDEGRFEANLSEQSQKNTMTDIDASKVVFISATNAAKELAGNPRVTSEQFEARAEQDGLNRYVLDRHSAFIPVTAPTVDVIKNIIALKLIQTRERFKASGYELKMSDSDIIAFLMKRVAEESKAAEGKAPIGFSDKAADNEQLEEQTISVRRVERELKDLERRISQYLLANSSLTDVKIIAAPGGLSIGGGDGCDAGFAPLKKAN
jgi:replication-associated recombination protein RarA